MTSTLRRRMGRTMETMPYLSQEKHVNVHTYIELGLHCRTKQHIGLVISICEQYTPAKNPNLVPLTNYVKAIATP